MHTVLNNIRIVLVEPSHPGNIGAVARAMKVMGLEQLYLVKPRLFPHEKATIRAAHAIDVLMQAVVVDSFAEAVRDCHLVLGTSVRTRALPWPTLDSRAAAQTAVQAASARPIALIFGREKSGLTNEELQCCHYQVEIPANPAYGSLNLACAVQVLCYEIRMALMAQNQLPVTTEEEFATAEELEKFYQHITDVLVTVEFLKPEIPNQVISRLRRLYNRARLEKIEINVLRGILTAIQKKL